MNIGLAIQEIREKKGLSREAVALRAGVTPKTIHNAETGVYSNKDTIELIAKALHVTPGFITLMAIDKDDFHPSKHKYVEKILPHIRGLLMFLAE